MSRLTSLAASAICVLTTTVLACPFCGGPPTQAWSELLAEADVVLFVKLVSADAGASGEKPTSTVEVVRVHKGDSAAKVGETLVVDDYLDGKPGSHFILNGSLVKPQSADPESTFAGQDATKTVRQVAATETDLDASDSIRLRWDLNEQLDAETFEYIVATPTRDLDASKRLRYFAKHLESPNDIISIDVFSEFAGATYKEVASIRDELDREKLRSWIANPNTSPDRLGLYGMMLGLCGTEEDALFLKEQIGLPVNDEIRFGVDGLMGGLLLLSGREGLEFIQETRIRNTSASALEAMAAKNALEFIYSCEPEMFPKTELASSLHGFVQREDMRELTISQLARWQDWSLIDQLPKVYQQSLADDDLGSVRAVVGYLLALQKTCSEEPESENFVAAGDLLEQIRSKHGRLVRQMVRFAN